MAKVKELTDELKWIEEDAKSWRPPLDEFPSTERTFTGTFLKKTSENIFVPLGLAATTACLVLGLVNMGKGDNKRQQLFMRGRVMFQGLTIVAMALGLWMTGNRRKNRRQDSIESSK